MRSILTVTSAATDHALTTLERFKTDLAITGTNADRDTAIEDLIDDISDAVDSYLGRTLAKETVSESFRLDPYEVPEALPLTRWPVASITSVTVDGTLVDASEYEIDAETGQLYRLNASGYRWAWVSCKATVVVYVAGYVLPAESNRTLPKDIELGALAWTRSVWFARSRDPLVKVEDIPGVERLEYWVGGLGGDAGPPPDVVALIAPYRRIAL
jgi:hypothetical protein